MNFYSLPLIINDRRELEWEMLPPNVSAHPKNFIVEVPNLATFSLLRIPRHVLVTSFVAGEIDVPTDLLQASAQLNDGVLSLLLETKQIPKEEKTTTTQDLTFEELENFVPTKAKKDALTIAKVEQDLGAANDHIHCYLQSDEHAIALRARQSKPITEQLFNRNLLVINITLNNGHSTYTNTLQIDLAHPKQFLGIALDFGSESSQMAVKRYATDFTFQVKEPKTENLFRNIETYYKNNQWLDADETFDFYQEEKGTTFYKSLFFLRKDLSGEYQDFIEEDFIREADKNLKLLVNTSSFRKLFEQHYYQLPNMKILHRHDELLKNLAFNAQVQSGEITADLQEVKQKVYNSILKVMIDSLLKSDFIKFSTPTRLVRFMLLVPNNYDTREIILVQHQLNKIFEQLAAQSYAGKLLAWEVLTISESDAAFIGYLNKSKASVEKNKDYIIIDAGKGTTDFSIIRTGADNIYNLSPVYRNGFAGAGNLITYSLFETLLHFIREHNDEPLKTKKYIRDKILRVLDSDDLKRRTDFFSELERLKQHFVSGPQMSQVKKYWTSAQEGDMNFSNLVANDQGIEIITGLLQQQDYCADFYGYVQEACDIIANLVVHYLKPVSAHQKDFDCAGVILTGRAFMFPPLAQAIKQKLQQHMNISTNKVLQLQGKELKEIAIKGVFNNAIVLNAEKTGYPIQVIAHDNPAPPPEPPKTKKWSFNTQAVFQRLFNDLSRFEASEKILLSHHVLDATRLQQSMILIGSKYYQISGADLFSKPIGSNDKIDIQFSHRGYFVRRLQHGVVENVAELAIRPEDFDKEHALVIPSLFPVYLDEHLLVSLQRDDINPAAATQDNPLFF